MAQFGKYEIIRELGRGGMGVVFQARDTDLGRTVALKVMKPDSSWTDSESADFRRRFEIEARATAALDHLNIVTLFDRGEVSGIPFMAMAFIEGETLESLLKRRGGKLPVDEAVRILRPVGSALDYAHSRNVIHRDIKPANIMIRHDGHVLVMDFGIAKAAHLDTRNSSKVFGSPRYMAPEQFGFGKPTKAIDQWSLGVVTYEMLEGAWPFPLGEPGEEGPYYAILNHPPTVMANLPAPLNQAVAKALDKRGDGRYGSCSAFVDALTEAATTPASAPRRPATAPPPIAETVPLEKAPRTPTLVQDAAGASPSASKHEVPAPPPVVNPVVTPRATAKLAVSVQPPPPKKPEPEEVTNSASSWSARKSAIAAASTAALMAAGFGVWTLGGTGGGKERPPVEKNPPPVVEKQKPSATVAPPPTVPAPNEQKKPVVEKNKNDDSTKTARAAAKADRERKAREEATAKEKPRPPEVAVAKQPEPVPPPTVDHVALGDKARAAGDYRGAFQHYKAAGDAARVAGLQKPVEGDTEERATGAIGRGQYAEALALVDAWLRDYPASQRLARMRAQVVKARGSQ